MNIYEFAKTLGVSTGTVSRALNARPGVSPATREMILTRMKDLGYQPSRAAVTLASGKTGAVALWTPGVASSYVAEILSALEAELEPRELDLVVIDVARKRETPERLAPMLRWPVDGILVLDGKGWFERMGQYAPFPLPVIEIGCRCCGEGDRVEVSVEQAQRQALRAMAGAGATSIAYVVPVGFDGGEEPRFVTYVDEMTRLGLSPSYVRVESYYGNMPAVAKALHAYLERNPCPDAMFCFNDEMAIALQRALLDHGLRSPDDVLLAGCDGIEETAYLDPPLATLDLPIAEMCGLACEILSRKLEAPAAPAEYARLEGEWVPRRSVRKRGAT